MLKNNQNYKLLIATLVMCEVKVEIVCIICLNSCICDLI